MADRYWVGGGSSTNWSATGNTNWSDSSGGANNASVPGTGDNVFFDANSGAGASVLSASQSIGTLDMTGASISGLTHNTSVTLTVDANGGAFTLAAGKYTGAAASSNITFTGTSGTMVLTPNGNTIAGNVTINGVGGTVQLGSAFIGGAGSTIVLSNGTFDGNGFDVTVGTFNGNNSNVRTLTLGNGTWTLIATSGTHWSVATTTNLTFNKGTSNLVFGTTARTAGTFMSFGSLTYNNVSFVAPTVGNDHLFNIGGVATFAQFNIGAGNRIQLGANITISTAPTWTGTATAPILLYADAATSRTITVAAGTVSLAWGYLAGITGAGGATFVATNTTDGGSNSGWTISPPSGGGGYVIGG